jgi:hypothetical protein
VRRRTTASRRGWRGGREYRGVVLEGDRAQVDADASEVLANLVRAVFRAHEIAIVHDYQVEDDALLIMPARDGLIPLLIRWRAMIALRSHSPRPNEQGISPPSDGALEGSGSCQCCVSGGMLFPDGRSRNPTLLGFIRSRCYRSPRMIPLADQYEAGDFRLHLSRRVESRVCLALPQ